MDSAAPADRSPLPGAAIDLGRLDYRSAHARQLELLGEVQRGEGADTLVLVEHPHVITLGRTRDAQQNVLEAQGVEVVFVERGGDVTYHGPGQIVAYPIVLLREGERDLHRFLRNLEEAIIATLSRWGLKDSGREAGKTGVWRQGRKLASIGIACRKWVTFHGLALNVTTDLSFFRRINPCGFDAGVMTSMARELGSEVDVDEVRTHLTRELGRTLGRDFGVPESG